MIAYLSGRNAWGAAFAIGSACAVAAALLWLGIDADRAVTGEEHPAAAQRPTPA